MNISSFAEYFVPILNKNKLSVNKNLEEKYKQFMLSLFKNILEAEKYIQKSVITIIDNKEQFKPIINNSRFFPKKIYKYIQNTPCSLIKYNCKINGRENNIYFYNYVENTLNISKKCIEMMYIWLYICINNSEQKCAKKLNIHIYLTPFKKILPQNKTTIISNENVNTAFTYCCLPEGEIIIFREEEWFKVFIHETFHAYNLDFGLTNIPNNLQKLIKSIFHIKSDFNINEAYTETWTRIINCALYSFYSLSDKDKTAKTFLMYSDFCLQLERLFSIYQMNKILHFMGLNYTDICSQNIVNLQNNYLKQHLYKENTHVFGYYILTALFLNNYKEFIQWCAVNNISSNGNIIKFNCKQNNFKNFGDYIKTIYFDETLLDTLSLLDIFKTNNTSTRMSVVDIT